MGGCLLGILTLGIGSAIYAKKQRRQHQVSYYPEQGQPQPMYYDTANMTCRERKHARKAMKATRKAERHMDRGRGCCGGYRRQPQLMAPPPPPGAMLPEPHMGQDPAFMQQQRNSSYSSDSDTMLKEEQVYTPRTEEYVHVDDIYSGVEPPAYDASEGKGYSDDKKSATPM